MARVNTYRTEQNDNIYSTSTGFKILMLVCLFYIISEKDFSFSFSKRPDVETKTAGFAMSTEQRVKPKKKEPVAMNTSYVAKEKTEKKVAVKNNLANQFHNIAFILDPSAADRYNVSEAEVNKKNQICRDYIKKYAPIARIEQGKFGIPVSITLAQGLLESDAGHSRLAKSSTNHFGIKCFSHQCKKGHCKNFTDDTHKDFFVVYQNAWQSFRAHSVFLKQNRYQKLFYNKKTDYRSWAKGLKSAGYATDKNYDAKLIKIIETMKLNLLD
jgi:flagellum-specific peptidoglycan hydrolase FlgJ